MKDPEKTIWVGVGLLALVVVVAAAIAVFGWPS
jgi:uncharacterized membrane protein